MNCMVHGCQNKSDQGVGIYFGPVSWICQPCYDFLVTARYPNCQLAINGYSRLKEKEWKWVRSD